jgi:hypothetical protein
MLNFAQLNIKNSQFNILTCREGNNKGGTPSRSTSDRNAVSVALHDLPADGKPHAHPFVFAAAMKPLKKGGEFFISFLGSDSPQLTVKGISGSIGHFFLSAPSSEAFYFTVETICKRTTVRVR